MSGVRRNNLNLKFLDKESVLLQSIDTDCSTSNLSDVKIISSDGHQVFLHRIVANVALALKLVESRFASWTRNLKSEFQTR